MAGRSCPNCRAPISWREILEESTMGLTCPQCRASLETDRPLRILALLVGSLVAALAVRLWGETAARAFLVSLLGFFVGSGLAVLVLVQVQLKKEDESFV